MKSSIYAISLISLAVSVFSGSAQADGVTRVQLSSAPVYKVIKAKPIKHMRGLYGPRVHKGRVMVKPSYSTRLRIAKKKRLARARANSLRNKRIRANNIRINKARMNKKRILRNKIRIAKNKHVARYYYVRSGDSLYRIAKKHGVSVAHVIHLNKLKSTAIKVGKRLIF